MFKRALLRAVACLLLAAFGCDDSDDSATGPEIPSVQFTDFVHYELSQPYLLKVDDSFIHLNPEIYLWWEENFGEPFTDVDGDGVYTPGVDIFIMGTGDDNMDLNHDGRWNGPDEPWEPGMPFDDIDGNDTCREQYSYYYVPWPPPNVPYFDANHNGQVDSSLSCLSYFVHPVIMGQTDSSTQWGYTAIDTALYYLSDSGVTYYPMLGYSNCPICEISPATAGLEIRDQRLFFMLPYSSYDVAFELLSSGTIVDDSSRLTLDLGGYHGTCRRQIQLNQALTYDGITTSGLLKIRCDEIQFDNSVLQENFEGTFWEFYLSASDGLKAIYCKSEPDYFEPSPKWLYYFEAIDDPLPLLMTK